MITNISLLTYSIQEKKMAHLYLYAFNNNIYIVQYYFKLYGNTCLKIKLLTFSPSKLGLLRKPSSGLSKQRHQKGNWMFLIEKLSKLQYIYNYPFAFQKYFIERKNGAEISTSFCCKSQFSIPNFPFSPVLPLWSSSATCWLDPTLR